MAEGAISQALTVTTRGPKHLCGEIGFVLLFIAVWSAMCALGAPVKYDMGTDITRPDHRRST